MTPNRLGRLAPSSITMLGHTAATVASVSTYRCLPRLRRRALPGFFMTDTIICSVRRSNRRALSNQVHQLVSWVG
jgi:hypothetical protein